MAAATLDRIAAYVAVAGVIGIGAYLIGEQPASRKTVAGVATKLAELDARISASPAADATLRADIDELKSSVEGWAVRTVAAEHGLADLNTHFAALVPPDPILRADLSALQAALETRIARLEENVSAISPETEALAGKVAELDARLERRLSNLSAPDASLRSEVDTLKTAVQAISDGNAAVRAELDNKLAEIDRRMADLIAGDAASPLVQAGLGTKLAELDVGASALAAPDPGIRADLDALKSTFEGWRSESDRAGEILNNKLAELGRLVAALPTPDPSLRTELETLRAEVESQSTQAAASAAALELRLADLDALWSASRNPGADALPSAEALSRLEVRVAEVEQAQRTPATSPRVLETLYFNNASSELGDEEAGKLRRIADMMAERSTRLAIIGFTDTVGPPDYNRSLSLRRAGKVRTLLLGLGVEPASIISVDGVGEDSTPIRTADGEALANNRAVVVYTYE